MKIAFVMDPAEQLELYKDTSCFLMNVAQKRGHEVVFVEVGNIFVEEGEARCHGSVPVLDYEDDKLVNLSLKNERLYDLKEFDVILNRKDPPFDMNYIYLSYILDLVKDEVLVLNDPKGVRSANEKFYALNFPEFIPDTVVTRRIDDVRRFLEKHQENGLVLKPLDGKGGEGIFRLKADDVNKNQLMEVMTQGGEQYVVAQEFLPAIDQGDKRIVILNGEAISAFVRVPKEDDFRGNVSAGASSHLAEITDDELGMVNALKPFLVENGLWLVGLDVIGGKITEINVTSPIIGFQHHPENGERIIDFLERKV